METVFVYNGPHESHKQFALSVGSKFVWNKHTGFPRSQRYRILNIVPNLINGLLLPKADVYLCEGSISMNTAVFKKLIAPKCRIVTILSDPFFLRTSISRVEQWYISNFVSPNIDAAIAGSQLVKESAERFLECPIHVVNPYVRKETLDKLLKIKPEVDNHNIISIAGFGRQGAKAGNIPCKGVDLLLEAFTKVKKQVPDASLAIIGNIPSGLVKLPKGAELLGFVPDISKALKGKSVFCLASRADSFGVAVVEAMAAGIPAVVTNRVGAKEVVMNISPNLIGMTDPGDIAKKIIAYWRLPMTKRKGLSSKCKKIAKEFYPENKIKEFKAAFFSILKV